jgi:hypothetical protein
MTRLATYTTEVLFLTVLAILLGIGISLDDPLQPAAIKHFLREDGPVEWATVFVLVAGVILCVARFLRLRKLRPKLFIGALVLLALGLLFVVGEEISWGQRMLDIESPGFFREHNEQGEMNLHNFKIAGHKVNMFVFAWGLEFAILAYLVLAPAIHRNERLRRLGDRLAVPMPRPRHSFILIMIMWFVSNYWIEDSKKWELIEFAQITVFFLILLNPANRRIFNPVDSLR